ncbi:MULTISPECIES: DNA-3-methyladenine glycosylase family protein [unclassified Nitrospina]|uniref:DNA-3-methyladenine glycosylase family protein n=1 Tax=unclassified Nitrospina TaxID=2638683 RepID=UPI003F9B9045
MPPRTKSTRSRNHVIPASRAILRHFDRQDPVMAAVIRQIGPMRLRRNRNYFQVLCKAIVGQQISTRVADVIYARFQALFDGKPPTPDRVAGVSVDRLRAVGLSRQKAAYLHDLSARFLDKTIRPHQLNYLENEAIIERLTAVHGIGRWTAEMFLIFSLNRMDVLPVDDLGLRAAVKTIYDLPEMPKAKQLRSLAETWHPLETVATWYAWRALDGTIINY